MFVLEIRGYMQDADASGELAPVARISVHEDRDGDGVYETHHVFVDNLVFPRFVMPFGANAILTKESNADEVWKYTDTDGDGKADKKELFATGMGRLANVEHQESGLFWAMDNWMYSTVNQVRSALDAQWHPARAHRFERRPVGRDAGQLRQGLVPVRRERHAGLLPVSGRVRQLHESRAVRAESEHHVGRAGAHRRHAGWAQFGAHARRLAQPLDGRRRQRCLSRRPAAEGHGRRLLLRRSRRAHRPPPPSGQDRRPHAAPERLSAVRVHPIHRSVVPPGRHDDRARRHDVHHGHLPRHHPGVAVVGTGHVPSRAHQSVRARQGRPPRTHLAPELQGHATPCRTSRTC